MTRSLAEEADWLDGAGQPVCVEAWASGQPDNYGGNQRCVQATNHFEMMDSACADQAPFVCEMTLGAIKPIDVWATAFDAAGSAEELAMMHAMRDMHESLTAAGVTTVDAIIRLERGELKWHVRAATEALMNATLSPSERALAGTPEHVIYHLHKHHQSMANGDAVTVYDHWHEELTGALPNAPTRAKLLTTPTAAAQQPCTNTHIVFWIDFFTLFADLVGVKVKALHGQRRVAEELIEEEATLWAQFRAEFAALDFFSHGVTAGEAFHDVFTLLRKFFGVFSIRLVLIKLKSMMHWWDWAVLGVSILAQAVFFATDGLSLAAKLVNACVDAMRVANDVVALKKEGC
jgi:hypothetical protein